MAFSTPGGSRLGDDLYSLYLAGVAWLVLPMYATGVALVLPSDLTEFSRVIDLGALLTLLIAIWSGYRGGPFTVNRAVVTHELGSPVRPRRILLPRLARQAVAYAALMALAANALSAMGAPGTFGYQLAARNSFVAGMAALAAVVQTAVWLVVWKGAAQGDQGGCSVGARRLLAAVALAPTVLIAWLVLDDRSLSGPLGASALAVALVVSVFAAFVAVDGVPIAHLWRRASALEGMRSDALSFDFQRVLVSLRRAVDHTEARRSPVRLARRWMPNSLWRYLAGFERGWNTRLSQLVMGAAGALLVSQADPANGVVALAISGAGMVVGFELASPVSSTAGQTYFGVHYPKGSMPVLRAEVITAVLIATAIGGLALGWLLGDGVTTALATIALFVFGTVAATVQGRLGSPDLAWLADKLGAAVAPVLWIRGLLGPLLCVALTVVISHGWLRPDEFDAWELPGLLIVGLALVIAGYPLEKSLP